MAQNTNLNVTPYYDDFDKNKNFYRVLYRPGYPIQARELTTMQSILQHQIENLGSWAFKDGSMVIPGQVGYDLDVKAIMLQESFLGANVEDYRAQLNDKIITGLTSGVKAKVLFSISAGDSDKGYITLYLKYIEAGGEDNNQTTFTNNEQLITDTEITFGTTLIEVGSPFAQLLPTDALQKGSVAYVQDGVYFIRGFFVDVPYQYILLDQYGTNPKYRVGLEILESIVTPEDDLTLNDNAAGTSNYAAPGSHRFRITTNLIKKLLDDDADKDFIELLRINGEKIEKLVDRSALQELEKTLALRTYEESGNYVLSEFQLTMRESVDDGFNSGVYNSGDTTQQGNAAGTDKFALEVSPGTAYVRGYRIKNLAPVYVDIDKPRDTNSQQNAVIAFTMGNTATVTDLYGFPNVSGSTVTDNYQVVELYDTFTASAGSASGNIVGYARVSACEYISSPSGTFGNQTDRYKLNLFDVQMLTVLRIASAKSINSGSVVVGRTSGARAYVVSDLTSTQNIVVYQVEGVFQEGEMLTMDGLNLDTIDKSHTYLFSDTRSFVGRNNVNAIKFTSDIVLDNVSQIQGASFTYDGSAGTLTGLQSNYAADLRPGDRLYFSDTEFVDIDIVNPTALQTTNNGTIFNYSDQVVQVSTGGSAPSTGSYPVVLRYRAQLGGQLDASLLSEIPRKYVRSISDESMIVRRTFNNQTTAGGNISITLPENESFVAINDENFTFTVEQSTSTNPARAAGKQLAIDTENTGAFCYTTFSSSDRTTLEIRNLTNITSVKVTATISKDFTQRKTKSPSQMFVVKVDKTVVNNVKQNYGLTYDAKYGTRIEDKEISLGVTDAYKVHAIYESLDNNDPVVPSVTLVEPVFFANGTIVKGRTSSARARVVDFNSSTLKLTVVNLDGDLVLGETLDGYDSNGAALTGIINDADGSIVVGSKDVTDRYDLIDGQTAFIYGTAYISRKKGVAVPTRKLKVVFDYYNHSATGDYFGGQSYLNTTYDDIPFYQNAFLADFLDFRPGVQRATGTGSGTVASPLLVTSKSFDFMSRSFPTAGSPAATILDIPKLDSVFRCDFDWYLPRVDKVFLLPNGQFQVIKGKSEENPAAPDEIVDGMLVATLSHNPYGFDPIEDTVIVKSENRRYTMSDIGGLEKRLDNVEYYTSLNLLESDTFNAQITDAQGKNRFKNGFIVDDFSDHSKSATGLEDYAVSLDYEEESCRPSHYTTNIPLIINTGLSTGYRKTGPLLSLPYEEEVLINQPYASRVENVNPFNVFAYIGRIDLTPASDDWVDTTRIPPRVTNIEGDFQATRQRLNTDNNGFAPIQWNSWRTNWSSTSRRAGRTWRSGRASSWGRGRAVDQNVHITTTTSQTRRGIRTRVVPRIDRTSMGDSVVSRTTIPFIRSRNVDVNIVRMKPRTSFFAFFDGKPIDNYLTPKVIEIIKDPSTDNRTNSTPFVVGETVRGLTSGCRFKVAAPNDYFKWNPYDDTELPTSYSSTTNFLNVDTLESAAQSVGDFYGNVQVGEILEGDSGATAVVRNRRIVTDRLGQYRGTFFIPDPSVDTNPRWATGTRTIRFTTNEEDSRLPGTVDSAAQAEYMAAGTLNTVQENILAVRNADIVRDTVTQDRTTQTTRTETRQVGWWDPLAQSFLVDETGGVFLTSVDVFFNTRDENIPISMQIRTMENGYPTTTILPFSDVTVNPADVQLSDTGAVATRFTFRAPVYIPQSIEHCFVLFSDSNSYKVWISRMGELDITGDRTISEQPYAGVLFKSQNATTWTADQYEDLKFTIRRAVFDNTGTSRITLNNAPLGPGNRGNINLATDAIQTFMPELSLSLAEPGSGQVGGGYTVGARIKQEITLAQATIKSIDTSGTNTILRVNDISGNWTAGAYNSQSGAVTNRVISSKTTTTVTVTNASGSFLVGEAVTGGTSGATAEVVSWNSGTNALELNYVSKEFANQSGQSYEELTATSGASARVNATSVTYAGDAVSGNAIDDVWVGTAPTYESSQRRILIEHSNHGMHDPDNNVTISGVISEVSPTYLTSAISATDTTINVNDVSAFHQTINGQQISASNPGFIMIMPMMRPLDGLGGNRGAEIISYSAINVIDNEITVLARGQGGTTAVAFADESKVLCYNLDGIPLTKINKTHEAVLSPTLDSYYLQTTSLANEGIKTGGKGIRATQNIQYEIMAPQIQRMSLPKTEITARVQTISGTSINNGTLLTQNSFSNTGEFYDVLLNDSNYFETPQLVCSPINESSELSGARSLRLDLTLTSEETNVSPIVDTDRMSATLITHRINSPTDPNTSLLATGDEHAAVYITKVADLTNPSGSIKLMFAAFRPPGVQIKPLYRVLPTGSTDVIDNIGYEFFPVNDATVPGPTDEEFYQDYEYEITGLDFSQYQIKLVFVSSNQAYVPIIKDLRAIALAV